MPATCGSAHFLLAHDAEILWFFLGMMGRTQPHSFTSSVGDYLQGDSISYFSVVLKTQKSLGRFAPFLSYNQSEFKKRS